VSISCQTNLFEEIEMKRKEKKRKEKKRKEKKKKHKKERKLHFHQMAANIVFQTKRNQ
jgi:hypothetical protein